MKFKTETPPELLGLEKVCRSYGRMKCGDVMMVWDYANECAVPEAEMPIGQSRWINSERAKFAALIESGK